MTPQLHLRTALAAALALAIAAGLSVSTITAGAAADDLRSPDAVMPQTGTAAPPEPAAPNRDLRSADARDAGTRDPKPAPPGLPTWPENPVPIAPPSTPVTVDDGTSGGFAWGDAAVGAAGALAIVVLLGGATALIGRRHRPATGRAATP